MAAQSARSDCAICHALLSRSEYLTLSCGHVFHITCIKAQLHAARPDPSQRLIFTGYLCAICRVFCDHPILKHLTTEPRRLLDDVNRVLLAYARGTTLDNVRATCAVYLCHVCLEPFVGGTVRCVDQFARHRLPPEERLCNNCALNHDTSLPAACTNRNHAYAHVWKCRLCCAPADIVYFSRTHLCIACEQRVIHHPTSAAILCKGETCDHPLLPGYHEHCNHPTANGEQLYYCAACHTTLVEGTGGMQLDDCSYNLVFNPSGALATAGWTHLTNDRWVAQPSDLSDQPHETNFVSTWTICVMAQVVDLARNTTEPAVEKLVISARFRGHAGHDSHYTLHASVLDNHCEELGHVTTGAVNTLAARHSGER